jgi:hypothetical protein
MKGDEERSIVTEVKINREIGEGPFDPVTQNKPIRRGEAESNPEAVTQSVEFPVSPISPRDHVDR